MNQSEEARGSDEFESERCEDTSSEAETESEGQRSTALARDLVSAAAALLSDRRVSLERVYEQLERAWDAVDRNGRLVSDGEHAVLEAFFSQHKPPSAKGLRRVTRALDLIVALREQQQGMRRFVFRRRHGWLLAGVLALLLPFASSIKINPEFGWSGRYYRTVDFRGEIDVENADAVNFEWGDEAPFSGFPADNFSVRWDTCLVLDEPTTVVMELGSDDGSRAFLDGEEVLNNWRDQAGNWERAERELDPGRYPMRVEYYERGGGAMVVFQVSTLDGPLPIEAFDYPPNPDDACAE